jgi:protein-disulfide isomerase
MQNINKTQTINKAIIFFNNNFAVILIIISAFLFGFAFGSIWKENRSSLTNLPAQEEIAGEQIEQPREKPDNVPPVSEDDHTKGASNPTVTIFEYSDFNCPFCARVHPTIQQLVDTYPDQIAWVYRNYLLGGINSLSGSAAKIGECIAQKNSNDLYWKYISQIYEAANSESGIDNIEGYYEIISNLGIDKTLIEDCTDTPEIAQLIEEQLEGARKVGVAGTPALILMSSDGKYEFIAGAVSYESLEDSVLQYFE